MLEDALTGRRIDVLPFEGKFKHQRARLERDEDDAIVREIRSRLDAVPVGKAISASWVPGADWTNTVFAPIYSKVCGCDFDASALFLGSFFQALVIEHSSLWRKVKQSTHGAEQDAAETTLYWRVD